MDNQGFSIFGSTQIFGQNQAELKPATPLSTSLGNFSYPLTTKSLFRSSNTDISELPLESSSNISPLAINASGPFIFNQQRPLSIPIGVATDPGGNVFVTSDNVVNTLITKFDPNGNALGQIPLGNITSISSIGKLALEPTSGQILDLFPDGTLISINPSNGAITPLFNVKSLPIDISAIYDVAAGRVDNFGGLIQPQFASYGDLAIFNGGSFLDLYISGISQAQTFPFVMRLRFVQGTLADADVLVSSRASAAPQDSSPPGVAVNSQGIVLTTLPIPNATATGNYNTPVALPVDLDLQQLTGSFLPRVVLNRVDISSRGMTTDAAGNFYIATSAIGTTLGGSRGSGATVILSPNLNSVLGVLTLGQGIFRTEDVAVTPSGNRVYITVRSPESAVVTFALTNTNTQSFSSQGFSQEVRGSSQASRLWVDYPTSDPMAFLSPTPTNYEYPYLNFETNLEDA
ncbi:MAG: hypothetical protein WCA35_14105 [Kovacikia sp.]